MFDPISLLTGAGLLGTGVGTGYISGRISEKRRRASIPKDGVCDGCGHHFSFHVGGKRCKHETKTWICDCRMYVGLKPYTEIEA